MLGAAEFGARLPACLFQVDSRGENPRLSDWFYSVGM